MNNRNIDDFFKENLDSIKLDIDVEAVWKNVDPNKKRKRRLFFILFGMGAFLILGGICFNIFSSDDDGLKKNGEEHQSHLLLSSQDSSSSDGMIEVESTAGSQLID
ncbi:MAG: hypothetical protein AAF242_15770, partial [Bacteroidota bacterium]